MKVIHFTKSLQMLINKVRQVILSTVYRGLDNC